MYKFPPDIQKAVDDVCNHIRAVRDVDSERAVKLAERVKAILCAACDRKPLDPEAMREIHELAAL
jgi:hypothetical protein